MREQHHLLKSERLQFLQPLDDRRRGADEAAVVQPEPGSTEPSLGDLADLR